MTFYTADTQGYLLRIKLTPNAAQNGFRGLIYDEKGQAFLKGFVTVIPEKGKANKALVVLLAKQLKTAKNSISLISGETDHYKKIYIRIQPSADFNNRLDSLIKE
ncbi:MAG: DUF167 family protein [Pseudomonadota bacterium]|nr:DUF167 family protein [Pseudomonadota bacterium]